MTQRTPAQTFGVLAIVIAVLAGAWFAFFSGNDKGADPAATGNTEVAEGSGELEAADKGVKAKALEKEAADATAKTGDPKREENATTFVRGVLSAGRLGSVDGATMHLVPASASTANFATFLSFTNPEQFKQLEGVFKQKDPVRETSVAADGRFVFKDPPPGLFELKLEHSLLRLSGQRKFEIAIGEDEDLGVVATEPAGSLVVVVTDKAGEPVSGADLQLNADFDPMQFADPEKLSDLFGLIRQFIPAMGKTDERGVYEFGGLRKAGTFLLAAEAHGHAPRRRTVRVVDGVQKVARVRLEDGAELRMIVKDGDGKPVAKARVTVSSDAAYDEQAKRRMFAGDNMGRERTRTDESGVATIDTVLPGRVDLLVRSPGFLKWTGEAVFETGGTVERTVVLARGLSISGTVYDENDDPVKGAHVGNVPELGTSFMGIEVSSMVPHELLAARPKKQGVETDEQGRFTLTGLKPGQEVHLMAVADGFATASLGPLDPGTADHTIHITRLGRVTGRVVQEEDGSPVAEFTAYCSRTQYLVFEGRIGRLSTGGEAGTFELADVPQGRQTLVITAPGRTPLRQKIEVGPGMTELGEIELAPASAIEGIVVDQNAQPVEGVGVRLAKGGFADFEMLAKMMGREIALTDADGRFRMEQVPAKRVKLIAEKKGYALKKSKIVRVPRGDVAKGVRIVIDTGGSLRGRIVDEKGRPLSDWSVQATGMRTATVRMAKTDAAGELVFVGLARGEYQIQAFPPDWMQKISQVTRESTRTSDTDEMPDMGKLFSATMRNMLQTKATVRAGAESKFELVWEDTDRTEGRTRVTGFVTVGGRPIESGMIELLELGGVPRMDFAKIKNGAFRYASVLPGSYRVRVRAGFFSAATFHDEIVRVPKQDEYELKIELPGGGVSGYVVRDDGKPAAHVMIKLSSAADARHFNPSQIEDVGQGMWLTDEKGKFSFDGLPGGLYTITARELTFMSGRSSAGVVSDIQLADGERRENIEIRIAGSARLTVRVTDATGLKSQALVRLVDPNGRPTEMFQASITDGEGEATFTGLPAGKYRVLADADDASPTLSRTVVIGEGGEAKVAVKLDTGVEVRLILEGETPKARPGEILVFSIWDPEGRLVRAGPASVKSVIDRAQAAKGGLRIGSLRPGTYRVRIESPTLGLVQAERTVPDEKSTVWAVNPQTRTIQRR